MDRAVTFTHTQQVQRMGSLDPVAVEIDQDFEVRACVRACVRVCVCGCVWLCVCGCVCVLCVCVLCVQHSHPNNPPSSLESSSPSPGVVAGKT